MSLTTRFFGDWAIFSVLGNGNVTVTGQNVVVVGNLKVTGNVVTTANLTNVASINVPTPVDSFPVTAFRSVQYHAVANSGATYQSSDVVLVHDNTTAVSSTTTTILTTGNLGVFSANVSAGVVYLNFSAANTNSNVKVYGNYFPF